ncbi:hypothetical protein [Vibrio owensii]|uniref:hypothetical protein n=1 Tax=Vibrio owensii TaxID=696485 RepID=UPI002FEF014E
MKKLALLLALVAASAQAETVTGQLIDSWQPSPLANTRSCLYQTIYGKYVKSIGAWKACPITVEIDY